MCRQSWAFWLALVCRLTASYAEEPPTPDMRLPEGISSVEEIVKEGTLSANEVTVGTVIVNDIIERWTPLVGPEVMDRLLNMQANSKAVAAVQNNMGGAPSPKPAAKLWAGDQPPIAREMLPGEAVGRWEGLLAPELLDLILDLPATPDLMRVLWEEYAPEALLDVDLGGDLSLGELFDDFPAVSMGFADILGLASVVNGTAT